MPDVEEMPSCPLYIPSRRTRLARAPMTADASQMSWGSTATDRGKFGTKRSVLTEGGGVPIGFAMTGAHGHDFPLAREPMARIAVERPEPTPAPRAWIWTKSMTMQRCETC